MKPWVNSPELSQRICYGIRKDTEMTTSTLTDMLINGFKLEFEKQVESELTPLTEHFNLQLKQKIESFNSELQRQIDNFEKDTDNLIARAKEKAKAEAAKASIDLLHESNFALFDLRFGYTKNK